MSVRAKFRVANKDETAKNVQLVAVVSGSAENAEFFSATPNGLIQLQIVNDAALSQFELGAEYYVDFTPATDE